MITQLEVDTFLRKTADDMVRYIRTKYNAPNFNPVIQTTYAVRRTTSRGGIRKGRAFINIVAHRFLNAANTVSGKMDEPEYKSFNQDPVIGGLYNITWKKALASLLAHELGHAVQYDKDTKIGAKRDLNIENLDDRNGIMTGHDWFWKRIYADLRIQFVNGRDYPLNAKPTVAVQQPTPKPVEPTKPAPAVKPQPAQNSLYTKYTYRGDITLSWYYVNQKLALVLAERNRKIYLSDDTGALLKPLDFKTLSESRKSLLGI